MSLITAAVLSIVPRIANAIRARPVSMAVASRRVVVATRTHATTTINAPMVNFVFRLDVVRFAPMPTPALKAKNVAALALGVRSVWSPKQRLYTCCA